VSGSTAAGVGVGPAPRPAAAAVHLFERRAMGSPLRLTLVEVGEGPAAAAWASVSAAIERAEQALSRYRETSDLTALNRRAGDPDPGPVGRKLGAALAVADRAHRLTGGAFDPRILADMERLGWEGTPLPGTGATVAGATSIARSATFAGGRWLQSDPRAGTAAVATPVDLGGIGKGLALRWAFAALRAELPGLGSSAGALLEAGGDVVAEGPAPQPGPWLVGIEDPLGGPVERAVVAVDRGAVCTSSVRVNARVALDGRPVHHLLDPRTGEPGGTGLLAVTVAGPDPAWAEVWSKTLFLQGARGIGPAARARGLAAWWVTLERTLEMTPAARQLTAWEGYPGA